MTTRAVSTPPAMPAALVLRVRAALVALLAAALVLGGTPARLAAQKALVVCPPPDAAGCERIAGELARTTRAADGAPAFPGGVDRAYEGLRTATPAQLAAYGAVVVPSLANAPYALLRESAVQERLRAALRGRVAVWSGTPDRGTTAGRSAGKLELIRNLARWAAADWSTNGATGLVALEDFSDVTPGAPTRYGWVEGIAGVRVTADAGVRTYAQVEPDAVSAHGRDIVGALAYDNMASFGLGDAAGTDGRASAWGVGPAGRAQVVLLTFPRTPAPAGLLGPAGGTLAFAGGRVRLAVPAGALGSEEMVTLTPIETTAAVVAGTAWELAPASVRFASGATLTLSLDGLTLPEYADPSTLALRELSAGAWVPLAGGAYDAAARTVSARVAGAGVFALGLPRIVRPIGAVRVTPATATVRPEERPVLTATVRDDQGAPASGRPVAWTSAAGGTLTPQGDTTDARGEARATFAPTGGVAGTRYAITATVGGTAGTATLGVVAGAPSTAAKKEGDGGSSTVGATRTLEVRVVDGSGNPVPGHAVAWTVTAGGGTLVPVPAVAADVDAPDAPATSADVAAAGPMASATAGAGTATSLTNAAGVAAVQWTLGGAAGTQSVSAIPAGLGGTPLTFAATAVAGAPSALTSELVVANAWLRADGTSTTTVTVRLRDAAGNPTRATAAVALATSLGTLGPVTDRGDGTYTATLTAPTTLGTASIQATLNGQSFRGGPTVQFLAGDADRFVVTAGAATAPSGGTVTVTAQLMDAFGHVRAAPGVVVRWSATGAGASLSAPTSTTGSNGVASVVLTVSPTAGVVHVVTATDDDRAGSSAPITTQAGSSSAAASTVAASPATLVADGASTTTITVRLRDAAGNDVPSSAGRVVALSTTLGTLGPVTNGGAGTFTATLTAPTSAGTATIGGTLDGAPLGATTTVAIVAGAPARWFVTAGAAVAAPGTPVAITARLADAQGNPVAAAGRTVTWSRTGTGGAFATPTSTTDASGVATVSFTTGTVAGTVHTVTATEGALTGTSGGVTVQVGAASPTTSTVTSSAATVVANGTSTATITVRLKDASGNDATTSGGVVTLSTDRGTLGAVSDAGNGSYTATLTAPVAVGTATIAGTLAGAPLAATTTVTFVPGAAAQYVVTASAASAAAAAPVTITAQLVDAHGNAVAAAGRTITWSSTNGGVLAAPTSATNASGVATVGFTTSGTAGVTHTVTATEGALTGTSGTIATLVGAASTATSTLAALPASITANGVSTSTITVRLKDAAGNALAAATNLVALSTTAGTLSAVTNHGDGTYTATLTAPTLAGGATVSGTLDGAPIASTATVTFTAAVATKYVVTASAPSVTAAGTVTITAQLADALDNPVPTAGATVTWSRTGAGGSFAAPTSTTNGAGVATVTFTVSGTAGVSHTVGATDGTRSGTSAAFTTTTGAAASLATHAGDGQTRVAGTVVPTAPAVRVTDAGGNPVAGVQVTFAVATGGGSVTGATPTTDATGVATVGSWTLGTTAGSNTLTASATGLTTVTFSATGTAGAATTIVTNGGDAQSAVVAHAVATAPKVLVTDASGNPVAGVAVTFAASGNGSVGGSPAITDAAGVATLGGWTLATTAGPNTLTATAGALTTTFGATGTFDVAASVTRDAGEGQSATAGTAVATAPRVRVADQYGNPVSGASVAFAASGNGGVTGSPATSGADGLATVGSWTLATTAGANTLTATSGALSASFGATGTAGAATQLSIGTEPSSSAVTGTAFATQPVVRLRDANGNAVSQAGVSVTAAIASGGGTLGGTATVSTDATGVATFAGLSITGSDGARTLSFSASGLTGATSATINLTVGVPAQLAILTQPSGTAQAGAALGTQPVVQLRTADGNDVAVGGVSVTASIASGGGTLGGTATVTTNASGQAVFTDLAIGGTAGARTIGFASGGLTGATSASVTVSAGAASALSYTVPPSAVAVTAAISPAVKVAIVDAYGNVLTGATTAVTVAIGTNPSAGTLGGTTTVSAVAGVATFSDLTLDAVGVGYTLAASAGALTGATSGAFTVSSTPPTAVNDAPAGSSTPGQAYHTAFNTTLAIPGGSTPNLLGNDTRGAPQATIASFGAGDLGGLVTAHAAGSTVSPLPGHADGSLTVNADGTASFTPPAGFTGEYTFNYRLQNAVGSSDGQVTIAVGVRPAATNDTYATTLLGNVPINTATSTHFRVTANDAGDAKVLAITGQTNGTATLNADSTFTFRPTAGYEGAASFTYTVTNGFGTSAPATVSMTVANSVWFVDAAAATNGDGRFDAPFNCLTGAGCLSATSADGTGDRIYLASGAYTGGLTLLNSQRLIGAGASGASFSSVAGVTWPADAGPEPAIGGAAPTITSAANGINLGSGNTLRGLAFGNATGSAISGAGVGSLTVADVAVNTTGRALSLVNGTVTGSFSQVRSTGGTNNIALMNMSASGAVVLGTAADALSGATSDAVLVNNMAGTGTFTYAGSITNAATYAVKVTSHTSGTLIFSGDVNPGGAAKGITVSGASGGSIVFSGSAQKISTGAGDGVSLTSNTGATVSFTGGGLAIATTTGTGLLATGGGTVIVKSSGADAGTIASTAGVALNVANTTIGTGGLNFRSIAAAGAANGIVLNATGSTNGLTVTGDGASDAANTTRGRTTAKSGGGSVTLGSGGTIGNTTGHGISLTNTGPVVLRNVTVQNGTGGDGIAATTVAGLTLDNVLVSGKALGHGLHGTAVNGLTIVHSDIGSNATDASTASSDVWNVRLDDQAGTASVSHSKFHDGYEHVFVLKNTAATASFTATNSEFTDAGHGDGLDVYAYGTSNVTASVQSSLLARNSAFGFDAGTETGASGTLNLTLNNNTFTSNFVGLDVAHGSSGTNTFTITNNNLQANTASSSQAINVNRLGHPSFTGFGLFSGTIAGNTIGTAGVASSGSNAGNGIAVSTNGNGGTTRVTITNNTINSYGQHGIGLSAADATTGHTLHARVQNNTIANGSASSLDGINVTMGALNTDNLAVCLDIGGAGAGNTVTNAVRTGIRVRSSGIPAAVVALTMPAWDGSGTAYFTGRNPAATGVVSAASFSNASGTTTAGSCTTP